MDWRIFSYTGLAFALLYRIPQIIRIYRTKSASDLSSYSYLAHNAAYLSFVLYLLGTSKLLTEWPLSLYYFFGLFQNILIFIQLRKRMEKTHNYTYNHFLFKHSIYLTLSL